MNRSRLFQLTFSIFNLSLFLSVVFVFLQPRIVEAQMCVAAMEPAKPPEEDEDEACKKSPECCKKSPRTVAKGNYGFSVVDLQIPTRGFPLTIRSVKEH